MVKRKRTPLRRSKHLCADAGYRSAEALRIIDSHGYIPHVVDRRQEAAAKQRQPWKRARRWVVEVCHSWFKSLPQAARALREARAQLPRFEPPRRSDHHVPEGATCCKYYLRISSKHSVGRCRSIEQAGRLEIAPQRGRHRLLGIGHVASISAGVTHRARPRRPPGASSRTAARRVGSMRCGWRRSPRSCARAP